MFGAQSLCTGLIPPQLCEGCEDFCLETDVVPAEPPASSRPGKPDPGARTVFFARDPASATPRAWTMDRLDDRKNWVAGKGLIFPARAGATGLYGVGFFGASMSTDATTRLILSFLAHSRMNQALEARGHGLSARQLETLRWAAEGKTDQEIATIMGVSGHTVDKYMRQSREALDAVNRTAVIVKAIRLGLIA